MPSTYAVTVQIWAQSPEEAVRRTIIPGSTKEAQVQDLAYQIQYPPMLPVPPAVEREWNTLGNTIDPDDPDVLPLY